MGEKGWNQGFRKERYGTAAEHDDDDDDDSEEENFILLYSDDHKDLGLLLQAGT